VSFYYDAMEVNADSMRRYGNEMIRLIEKWFMKTWRLFFDLIPAASFLHPLSNPDLKKWRIVSCVVYNPWQYLN
jgi:hypothetical protein